MTWVEDLPRVAVELEAPHIIAGRAWIAIRALYSAHGRLTRVEGDHLALLLRKRWYGRCGFASFTDFVREALQLSSRTARRRVALSRLTEASPELAAALDSGRLSPCQVLALSRLRDAPDLASWIAMAVDCTVRDLEQLVTNYLSDLAVDDEIADEGGEDEHGRRITFATPVSAAVAWQHGIDMAQRVLGWKAPTYQCVEALLAETAADLECGVPAVVPSATPITPPAGVSPAVTETRSPPEPPPDLKATRKQLEALLKTIHETERELASIVSTALPCDDDPDRSITALATLRRQDRNLRLLLARLLREAEAAGVFEFFGDGSATGFLVSRLKVSERTAARFMSEAWTFEDNPELASAFSTGRIGLGQAYLVNRVAVTSTQAAFIRRAEAVTHAQFDREVRFLERLSDYVPSVAQEFPGPFPLPHLPRALIQRLRDLGWTESRIEECTGEFDAAGDPAVDPLLMGRLEGLLNLVGLALEEHDLEVTGVLPTLATPPDDTQNQDSLGPLPTLATRVDHPTNLNTFVAGDSEALPMLATPDPHSRTTISFWAPEPLITQWNTALDRVRAHHGPLPTWAAALFLVRRAVEEWQRVDPSRRPAGWRILERDEWRCQAPGCSSRRSLEAHHIIFRSHEGTDDPENLITLCHGHHRHGIHDGYLEVKGSAPSGLRWRLGGGKRPPNGTPRPTRHFHGSRLMMQS